MLTFLFSACSSSMFDKLVEAYESSTKELASASSNDDCDRIHDELMEKLYKISQDYPDWEEIIQKRVKTAKMSKGHRGIQSLEQYPRKCHHRQPLHVYDILQHP